jgi:hypothetical protein
MLVDRIICSAQRRRPHLLSSHSSSSTHDQSRPAGIQSSLRGGDIWEERVGMINKSGAFKPSSLLKSSAHNRPTSCTNPPATRPRTPPAVQRPEPVVQPLQPRQQLLVARRQAEAAEDDVLGQLRRPHAADAARGVELAGAQLLAQQLRGGGGGVRVVVFTGGVVGWVRRQVSRAGAMVSLCAAVLAVACGGAGVCAMRLQRAGFRGG